MSNASDFIIVKDVLKKYKGSGGVVVIPEGIKKIGDSAFYDCTKLVEVIIPEGVQEIGVDAFCGCKNLKKINLPESVTTIKVEAFRGSGLESVVIPYGVKEIARFMFYGCMDLTRVNLPDGITEIGYGAFWQCNKLVSVNIPESVINISENAFLGCFNLEKVILSGQTTTIENGAFFGCRKLANDHGLIIVGNTVFGYIGKAEEVVIPEGISRIDDRAFSKCSAKKIVIPQSVTEIGVDAFNACISLAYISPLNPACKLSTNAFGNNFPPTLYKNLDNILPNMTDAMLKQYVVNRWQWKRMDPSMQQNIFATRQSTSMQKAYKEVITPEELKTLVPAVAVRLQEMLAVKATSKICNHIGAFLNEYSICLPDDTVQQFYDALKKQKTGVKAVKLIEENIKLMERLGADICVDEHLPKAEKLVMQMLLEQKQSIADLGIRLKDMYSLAIIELPELWYPNGSKVAPFVLAWLLTAHETIVTNRWNEKTTAVDYPRPGIRPEAKEILAELNPARVQRAMLALACAYLGITGRSKKMYLAYPICRYADEMLMEDLCNKAPKWRSQLSGNDAPPLLTFRMASVYSETRTAMLFADKFNDLDQYAEIRGTDADTIRDKYLSDVGLDTQGGKAYDLGNQTVTVRLQKDLSFLVEVPGAKKPAKSIPKKGADTDMYATANADFTEMKKNVKKIIKRRNAVLFEDFLSGRERNAADWKDAYLNNPLLRTVASLLVWSQKGKTFTLTEDAAVTAKGKVYTIGDDKISLAHPMKMSQTNLSAWQKYFASHGLKQPFEQIWEPVMDLGSVAEDRYAGCMIPYYRFAGQAKHGVHVEDSNFHNEIYIYFDDCKAQVERIDWLRHMIEMDHRFEIKQFSLTKHNRKTNHIVAYLDRITIFERIRKDDVSVAAQLHHFTLAQITEFIKVAAENNCTNVQAVLLDYKNRNFADFDPMEEFSLDL